VCCEFSARDASTLSYRVTMAADANAVRLHNNATLHNIDRPSVPCVRLLRYHPHRGTSILGKQGAVIGALVLRQRRQMRFGVPTSSPEEVRTQGTSGSGWSSRKCVRRDVVDQRVVGKPFNRSPSGAGVTEGVPRRQQLRVVLV
jgi:hypothetical protein